MPLTLEQYAESLENRADLPMPEAPAVDPLRARPHLVPLPKIRAVLWNVYGTLLVIEDGELKYEHPNDLRMNIALEKTIQEFRMWNSMSRKPGQPSEYMREIFNRELAALKMAPSVNGEKFPEIRTETIWESIVRKLQQKDYKYDAALFGGLNEFSRKISFFFHSSLQGTTAYPEAASTMLNLAERGMIQGLLSDGQVFTPVQVSRALRKQNPTADLGNLVPAKNRILSCDHRCRKPSPNFFLKALEVFEESGIEAEEILHVGSDLDRDIAPAREIGMKTALFAGDRNSLKATTEKLKDPRFRPDVLLTELAQVATIAGRTG